MSNRPVSKQEVIMWSHDATTKKFFELIKKWRTSTGEYVLNGSTLTKLGEEIKETSRVLGAISVYDELLSLNLVEELSDGEE